MLMTADDLTGFVKRSVDAAGAVFAARPPPGTGKPSTATVCVPSAAVSYPAGRGNGAIRRAVFELAARYRQLLYQTAGLWLGRPTGRVNSPAMGAEDHLLALLLPARGALWGLGQRQFFPAVGAVHIASPELHRQTVASILPRARAGHESQAAAGGDSGSLEIGLQRGRG